MARTSRLTKQQLKRLSMVAKMRKKIPSNEGLAKEMNVSVRTIESYITKFMRKPARIAIIGNASGLRIDKQRFRQFLQLCHPDKHNGSLLSNEVTQWLLGSRNKISDQ